MKNLFSKIKEKVSGTIGSKAEETPEHEEYVELESEAEKEHSKIVVRPFVLEDFEDIKPILDALREGYTIALVNIKPLKDKDLVELKRAINKLKKTTDAIDGDMAGFGDDWITVVPSFAQIYRTPQTDEIKEEAGHPEPTA